MTSVHADSSSRGLFVLEADFLQYFFFLICGLTYGGGGCSAVAATLSSCKSAAAVMLALGLSVRQQFLFIFCGGTGDCVELIWMSWPGRREGAHCPAVPILVSRDSLKVQQASVEGQLLWCDPSTGSLRPLVPMALCRQIFDSTHGDQ